MVVQASVVEEEVAPAVQPPEGGEDTAASLPSEQVAVRAENIVVRYRSYNERPSTLKETIVARIRQGKMSYFSTFNALDDVSFTIKKGEVFGILGSNGAGKSTMLRVLAGVLPPSEGSVTLNGSVDSLIQLGAGFDPELNAIENIYLSGALHQKSKEEIKDRIPQILEFAELTECATKPIKYYSSGMYARLGFGVAIDKNPDILLVDEVLAVGDERFQAKCRKVFARFLKENKTIVIVSHSPDVFKEMAHRACLLSKGRRIYIGDPDTALAKYRDENYQVALG